MKWYGITGSWRNTNREVKRDIERTVEQLVVSGGGIVTGGALGVDYFATQKVLKLSDKTSIEGRLKIILPVSLKKYCRHFYRRAGEGIISERQADELAFQLTEIKELSPKSIIDESDYLEVNKESYFARINKIVDLSDEIYAFHVNNSEGVKYSIDVAKKLGKPVFVKKYNI